VIQAFLQSGSKENMADFRIKEHPILPILPKKQITFTWQDKILQGVEGESIASALFANGIKIFGHHSKDGSPLGIFCANGQCSQCMVIADGRPVKACMTAVTEGMQVFPSDGLPTLPKVATAPTFSPVVELRVPVLIIGGGPAGLSAAIELG
jgi:sarcosine oxidase, subunit alpha